MPVHLDQIGAVTEFDATLFNDEAGQPELTKDVRKLQELMSEYVPRCVQ
jgi:hypothetical protein